MSSSHLIARIHSIHNAGRTMTLRRQITVNPVAFLDVALVGHMWSYRPEQLAGDIRQGDAQVAILNLEIAIAGWPGPPRSRDQMIIDNKTWNVIGARTLFDGALVIGHEMQVRGA